MTRNLHRMMTNCARTILLDPNNGSHNINLDRIAEYQDFDPTEFRALFLEMETKRSLEPDNYGGGK